MTESDVLATNPLATVRRFRASDLETYRAWLAPDHEWRQWDAPYFAPPSAAEVDAMVQRVAGDLGHVTSPPQRAAIVRTNSPDELVGMVSWYWESEETNWRRLGIVLFDPATRGQGIGSAAFALWTSHVFAVTDVTRLDFATWSGNAGMLGIGRSLGFVEEGRFRRARIVRGNHYDSVVMGVLREEWTSPGA